MSVLNKTFNKRISFEESCKWRNDKKYTYLLFLIHPLSALLMSFQNIRANYVKNLFWLFCIFYGFTFAIGKETLGSDINRYLAEVQLLHHNIPELSFQKLITYYNYSGEVDILRILISYLISRFTGSQTAVTTVYAFVFGFFYSRNMWLIINKLQNKLNLYSKLLLTALFLVIPIWFINGFRMWTAMHIFLYGLIPYLLYNNKKGIFISMISILVHFSFIIPIIIFGVFIILKNRIRIYFFFFLFSLVFSTINIAYLNNVINEYVPQRIVERSESYLIKEKVDEYRIGGKYKNTVWYVKWHKKLLMWSLNAFMILFYWKFNTWIKNNTDWSKLFAFTLLFFGTSNFLSSIPSGSRFLNLSFFLSLSLILLIVNKYSQERSLKIMSILTLPSILLFIIISFRIGLYFTGLTTLISNPIIAFLTIDHHISLNDLIK